MGGGDGGDVGFGLGAWENFWRWVTHGLPSRGAPERVHETRLTRKAASSIA